MMNLKQYKTAKENVRKLWGSEPGTENGDLLELLISVVEDYEARSNVMGFSPLEAVKHKMGVLGLRQVDLAPVFGGKNRVSEFFSGRSGLTMKTIKRLRHGLGIPYEQLIGPYDPVRETLAPRVLLDTDGGDGPKRVLVDTDRLGE